MRVDAHQPAPEALPRSLAGRARGGVGTASPEADEKLKLVSALTEWLLSGEGKKAVARLNSDAPGQLPALTAVLGLASLRAAHDYWMQHQKNPAEEFWQSSLEARSYVLGQVFAYPVVVIGTKVYVGGKQIDARGGKYPDFALSANSTSSILLLEIKTPVTELLGAEYRNGVFPLSREVQGALAQVLRYRQILMRTFDTLTSEAEERLTLGEPRCVVVAGNSSELNTVAKKECYELQRERVGGVTLVTYDEASLESFESHRAS